MRIGIINLITKTATPGAGMGLLLGRANLSPATDGDLNIVELGKRMVAGGDEVTILVSDAFLPEDRAALPEGLRIEYLPTRGRFPFSPAYAPFTPSLRRRVQEMKFDVLQAEEVFQLGTSLGWLACGDTTPFFVWQELDIIMRGIAGRMQRAFYSTIGRRIAESSAAVIPRSVSALNHLKEFGLARRTERVIHSGVDTEVFKPVQKEKCRATMALSEFESVILSVGRLHASKGFDLAIEAFASIAKENDACLVIKGQGAQLDELRGLAARLGVSEQVKFVTGYLPRSEMVQLYNSADALLVSSRNDLFPFAAIESISCGVPVVTSFGRGLKTDIVDQGAGLIIPNNLDGMSDGLSGALSDKGKLSGLGIRGRQLALEEFEFRVMADRFLEIYRRHED